MRNNSQNDISGKNPRFMSESVLSADGGGGLINLSNSRDTLNKNQVSGTHNYHPIIDSSSTNYLPRTSENDISDMKGRT